SERIVPVLAEAVRQTESKYALAIAPTESAQNALAESLKTQAGYNQVITGSSLSDRKIVDVMNALPGVDVIVVQDTPDRVQDVYAGSTRDYKLGGVPVIAITGLGDRAELSRRLGENPRRFSTVQAGDDLKTVDLKAAIEQANAAASGA